MIGFISTKTIVQPRLSSWCSCKGLQIWSRLIIQIRRACSVYCHLTSLSNLKDNCTFTQRIGIFFVGSPSKFPPSSSTDSYLPQFYCHRLFNPLSLGIRNLLKLVIDSLNKLGYEPFRGRQINTSWSIPAPPFPRYVATPHTNFVC